MPSARSVSLWLLMLLLGPAMSWGMSGVGPASDRLGGSANNYTPEGLEGIGITEHLGETVPLETRFTDQAGNTVPLRDLIGDKPVILQLGYFECPMLCGLVAGGWVESIAALPLELGKDYEVLSISIDPKEDFKLAAEKKESFLKGLDKPINASGVHYLVGTQQSIDAVTKATGFEYKWVESAQQFSHPAAIMVLSPSGKISHYLYGIKYDPGELSNAIAAANAGETRSSLSQFVMTCFHYAAGGGQVNALSIMRLAGIITVIGVAGAVFVMIRRENAVGNDESDLTEPRN